jgi:hypothetical protein
MIIDPNARSLRVELHRLWLGCWAEHVARQMLRGLGLGIALALGGALVLVVHARLVNSEVLFMLAAACLLVGTLGSLVRPPSRLRAARVADARWGLDDRLGTAVELLDRQSRTPLEQAQLGDAARSLRSIPGRWRWPRLTSAKREGVTVLVLTVLLMSVLWLEGQGESLIGGPGWLGAPGAALGDQEAIAVGAPSDQSAPGRAPSRTSDALRQLDQLDRARESGALSEAGVGQALDRLESDLRQRSGAARQQGESLDRLAQALGQVSAGESAAESLRQGDAEQAADQLRELGREADQLSPEAKSQLAEALRQAAADGRTERALADREQRAADALGSRDYPATSSALAALGDEVQQSSARGEDGQALADALQRLDQERTARGENGMADRGDQANSANSSARQTLGGQPGTSPAAAGGASGSQAGTGEGSNQPGPGAGGMVGEAQTEPPGVAGGPSGARDGGDALGDAAPPLDVVGQPVEVPARPASPVGGLPTDAPGADDEPVGGATVPANEAGQPPAQVQSGGQIERVVVPGDQRSVVREYFARRGGKGTP